MKSNKVIGFTSVVGDFLHAGHALMLNECKKNVGFSNFNKIKKSVENYINNTCEDTLNDYSELLKYIKKKSC